MAISQEFVAWTPSIGRTKIDVKSLRGGKGWVSERPRDENVNMLDGMLNLPGGAGLALTPTWG